MKQRLSPSTIQADPAFPDLKTYIVRTMGLTYQAARDAELAQRLAVRLEETRCADCREYLRRLDQPGSHEEREALIRQLTIGETYFFRFRQQFEALREVVLPDLIARRRAQRRLRIWSAGCATGPEPYSLSILLQQHFQSQLAGWDVEILGTDINAAYLEQAHLASYNDWALRSLPEPQRHAYFIPEKGRWTLREEYRRRVRFQVHNLVQDPFPPASPPGSIDLILCRNVLIYFSRPDIACMAKKFNGALAEDGWLLVGHAELTSDIGTILQPVQVGEVTLFRKGSGAPTVPLAGTTVHRQPAARAGETEPWRPYEFTETIPAIVTPADSPAAGLETAPGVVRLRELSESGAWAAAAALGRCLAQAQPLDAEVHFRLALALEGAGDAAQAERELRRAIYLRRDHALAHFHLGLALSRKHEYGPAARSLNNALHSLRHLPDDHALDGGMVTVGEVRRAAQTQLGSLPAR